MDADSIFFSIYEDFFPLISFDPLRIEDDAVLMPSGATNGLNLTSEFRPQRVTVAPGHDFLELLSPVPSSGFAVPAFFSSLAPLGAL